MFQLLPYFFVDSGNQEIIANSDQEFGLRLIVRKLQKLQKTLQKTLPTAYSGIYRIFYRKSSQREDFGVSSARILCPLEYILSVGERFWNFFFPGNPKKTPTFFTISLFGPALIQSFLLNALVLSIAQ